jgi:hypothetical protein
MDSLHESNIAQPPRPAAPLVVVFYSEGHELNARIRDVKSQEQWVLPRAQLLQALLAKPGSA